MKCPKCNGKGDYFKEIYNDGKHRREILIKCNKCNGTGEIEMTNDEWRKTCSTEEFAELIALICGSNILLVWRIMYHCADSNVDAVKMWLKQPHKPIS